MFKIFLKSIFSPTTVIVLDAVAFFPMDYLKI